MRKAREGNLMSPQRSLRILSVFCGQKFFAANLLEDECFE